MVKVGNNRDCVIQSWLSAWVVKDFISHSLHSVVAWFAIRDFCLPCSKEKRSDWPFRRIYIWICSKGFDECRGFIFSPENSTIASGEVNTILFITVCLAHWKFPSDYKITSCFAQTRKYSLTVDNFSLSSLQLVLN